MTEYDRYIYNAPKQNSLATCQPRIINVNVSMALADGEVFYLDTTVAPFIFLKMLHEFESEKEELTKNMINNTLSKMINDKVMDRIIEKGDGNSFIHILKVAMDLKSIESKQNLGAPYYVFDKRNELRSQIAPETTFAYSATLEQYCLFFSIDEGDFVISIDNEEPFIKERYALYNRLFQDTGKKIANDNNMSEMKQTLLTLFFTPKAIDCLERKIIAQKNDYFWQKGADFSVVHEFRKTVLEKFGALWKLIVEIYTKPEHQITHTDNQLWKDFCASPLMKLPIYFGIDDENCSSFLIKEGVLGLVISKDRSLGLCDFSKNEGQIVSVSHFNLHLSELENHIQLLLKQVWEKGEVKLEDISEAMLLEEEENKNYHATLIQITAITPKK